MPTEGKRADDSLDDAGIEASSAEKWSDPVREGVTMAWSSAENRSEHGSSGSTGCGWGPQLREDDPVEVKVALAKKKVPLEWFGGVGMSPR